MYKMKVAYFMKLILKIFLGLIVLFGFLSASFPDLTNNFHGINFIDIDKDKGQSEENFTSDIVEAQTQKFIPNQNLVTYDGRVPVLMYHVIGNRFFKKINGNVMEEEKFEKQMQWLYENGYNTITPDQLHAFITAKTPLPPKPILLTFDDGRRDSYTTVFPILKKYNFTATMFIVTKTLGSSIRVNQEEIKEMLDYGITIGSHTVSHLNLSNLSKEGMRKELISSKRVLEENFGITVNYLCYPSGRYDDMVLEVVKEAKYLGAFTTHFGRVEYGDDPFTLVRVRINRSDSLKGFILKVERSKTYSFSTPRHGAKKNKRTVDDEESELDKDFIDNNNQDIKQDSKVDQETTNSEQPSNNQNNPETNDEAIDNDIPINNQNDNGKTNSDNTSTNTNANNNTDVNTNSNTESNINSDTSPSGDTAE